MSDTVAQLKITLRTCSICLDKMILKKDTCTTLCKHSFHKSCLDTWNKQDCPVCRQNTGAVIKIRDELVKLQLNVSNTESARVSAVAAYREAKWQVMFAGNSYDSANGVGPMIYPGWVPPPEEYKNKCLVRLIKSRLELTLAQLLLLFADIDADNARSEYADAI